MPEHRTRGRCSGTRGEPHWRARETPRSQWAVPARRGSADQAAPESTTPAVATAETASRARNRSVMVRPSAGFALGRQRTWEVLHRLGIVDHSTCRATVLDAPLYDGPRGAAARLLSVPRFGAAPGCSSRWLRQLSAMPARSAAPVGSGPVAHGVSRCGSPGRPEAAPPPVHCAAVSAAMVVTSLRQPSPTATTSCRRPPSTTLRAPVSAARAKTSYASSMRSSGKVWVTSCEVGRCPAAAMRSRVGVE